MEEFGESRESVPENTVAGVHSILGQRGSGKSCLLRKVCLTAERLLIVDTLGEHCAAGYVEHVPDLRSLIDRLSAPRFRLGYCPSPNGYEEVEYVERLVASRFQITLAVDEIDRWYPSPLTPLGDGLASVCNYGRHYGQGLVTTVRRPAAVSRHLTAQGVLWAFPMRDDRDRGYILRNTGVDAAGIGVLSSDANGHTRVTEVLRHERETQVLRFDLVTGELYESSRLYQPLASPVGDDADDLEDSPDLEEIPEPETVQEPTETPREAA